MRFDFEFWQSIFEKIIMRFAEKLPSLAGVVILIITGWILASLSRKLIRIILLKTGIDKASEKTGLAKILQNAGIHQEMNILISRFVFWIIFLLFILAAAESLKLNAMAQIFESVLLFLPRILIAGLIIILGGLFAGFIGNAAIGIAEKSGFKSPATLSALIKYFILIIVFILAIQKLGVETELLSNLVLLLVAAFTLSLSIAFGLGSRALARNVIAGFHAREYFHNGMKIRVKEYLGTLRHIGTIKFILKTENESISLPNHLLTDEEVIIIPKVNETKKER